MPTKPLTPEVLVPRLGEYLVERNLITREALELALNRQEELRRQVDDPPLLGQILVEMGSIDRVTLDEAITEQIIQLRAALEETNRQLERRVQERTAELQQAYNRLAELDQLKSNFVANISHELRTPLTHVRGYLDLLKGGDLGPVSPDQHSALNTMDKAVRRLARLIEDLILFSTAEHQQITLRQSTFNLSQMAQACYARYQPVAAERRVDLQLLNSEPDQIVLGDSEKIAWVIQQLLENAIKFTPAGGTVQLSVEPVNRKVRCSVRDSGIGIPEDQFEAIFTPFHQLDSSSTRRYGGTGLGLSLVKKIVEAHGSVVEVQSTIGKGSQFSFSLQSVRDTS
ncbi:MAG TPA: hypothetical protein GYA06_00890 [Chloroflexi bacterium]|nr:hypothetical protein [Chloroflexota bacterium]HPO59474.1 ATP-binding protein [Anaerolineaceae bacterium]